MNYFETIQYLYQSLPMFQRVGKSAYKSDLVNTHALDKHFNHPHRNFRSVHVAGTNGKGSVSHMLASVFQEAGYKTGLYTSPHLKDFRERIRINGTPVPEDEVVKFVDANKQVFEKIEPSFFEMTVAMAFHLFEKEKVELAVVEVGMGGRLDSTNILHPLLTVITNIGYDHTEFLGSGLAEIAGEKAGIIKEGIPVIIGETQEEIARVFNERAKENNCEILFADQILSAPYSFLTTDRKQSMNVYRGDDLFYEGLKIDQAGMYQRKNVVTSLVCLEELKKSGFSLPDEKIRSGYENVGLNTGLLGRWQILEHEPLIICDTAHNPEGISSVVSQIAHTPHKDLYMVIGAVNDKNIDPVLRIWPENATYFFTQAGIPRAMDAGILAEKAAANGLHGKVIPSVREALAGARSLAGPKDLIFIGGSTFVIAEVV